MQFFSLLGRAQCSSNTKKFVLRSNICHKIFYVTRDKYSFRAHTKNYLHHSTSQTQRYNDDKQSSLNVPEQQSLTRKNSYSQEFVDSCFDKDIEFYKKHQIVYIIRSSYNRDSKFKVTQHSTKILEYFTTTTNYFTCKDISNIMYSLGQLKFCDEDMELFLSALSRLLSSTDDSFTSIDFSMAMYGLRHANHTTNCNNLIDILTIKLSQCNDIFTSQGIANTLCGLQNLNVKLNPSVLSLLKEVDKKLAACTDTFNDMSLRLSLTGLGQLNSHHTEVQSILQVLVEKFEYSFSAPFITPVTISQMLYGLRSCSSDDTVVRELLLIFIKKIELCKKPLTASQITKAIRGLQNMKSDAPEVLLLVKLLTSKFKTCTTTTTNNNNTTHNNKKMNRSNINNKENITQFKAQEVCDIFIGIQNMSSEYEEVRQFISVLTMRINDSIQLWKSEQVQSIISSLQNLQCEHSRVRKLLIAITNKIKISQIKLTHNEVDKMLIGLSHMNSEYDEVKELTQQLVLKCNNNNNNTSAGDNSSNK